MNLCLKMSLERWTDSRKNDKANIESDLPSKIDQIFNHDLDNLNLFSQIRKKFYEFQDVKC